MTVRHHNNNDVDFSKDLDVDVNLDLDVDVDVHVDKDVDIDVKVDSDVDVDGNFAQLTFDVEAIGDDTFAEADVFVLTIEDELSHVGGIMTSAVS
jgi:hypothetical protein